MPTRSAATANFAPATSNPSRTTSTPAPRTASAPPPPSDLRARAVSREVRACLRDLRLLPTLHRLLRTRAERPQHRRRELPLPHRRRPICVLEQSAVKCVHAYAICGYCQLCTGYFEPEPNDLNTGAENCLCPTAAVKRTYVEDPYYEYTIDERLCIGCSKCVEGCNRFGNGSLFLQVRHDRCVNCNECAISKVCAGDAFRRVPADHPYLLKTTSH